jgi:chromosome condensin MukBEF ATPase and DNA-binding subunit MukB
MGSPFRGAAAAAAGGEPSKALSHALQQLRQRDAELAVLSSELEAVRAQHAELRRAAGQQQARALQAAEQQLQELQRVVSACGVVAVAAKGVSRGS